MSNDRLKTIAMGYLRAYDRVLKKHGEAYVQLPSTTLRPDQIEEAWAALFEALSWLDALLIRPEFEERIDAELRNALRFVRGRVHHRIIDAIEFRPGVPLELRPSVSGPIIDDEPLLTADWAWVDPAKLGSGRRGDPSKAAYTKLLAGRQVRAALDDVAELAAKLYNKLSTSPTPQ